VLEEPVVALAVHLGEVYVVRDPSRSIAIEKLAWIAHRREGTVPADFEPGLEAVAFYDPPASGVSSHATHAVAVEVDAETGAVKVLRYVIAEDAGRMINPMIVEGQLRGGAAQGVAKALFEEMVYDSEGQLLNASLMDFLMPTMSEICNIEVAHLESPSPLTAGGMKGCGESGIIGSPGAIGNAIVDALGGRGELTVLPFTPERVRKLIQAVS